ncbi:MAG: tRNA pseudouridine(38-40) synthase TruA [Anaerolineae bacterium]
MAVLEYDGTDFVGFQIQKSGRTVQAELERALAEFRDKPIRVTGGGRTDAGVHAAGQTASFTIDWTRDLETLHRAINAKLPPDMSVRRLCEVPENFSARYSATSRAYEYRVYNAPDRSALTGRFALWISNPLDVEAMQQAVARLVGWKDFGAFGTPPHGENTVRELKRAEVWRNGEYVLFRFEANAFLYRMVRRLVGTCLQVGRGEMDMEQFQEIVDRKRRAGDSVPPQGLMLMEIRYDPSLFQTGHEPVAEGFEN